MSKLLKSFRPFFRHLFNPKFKNRISYPNKAHPKFVIRHPRNFKQYYHCTLYIISSLYAGRTLRNLVLLSVSLIDYQNGYDVDREISNYIYLAEELLSKNEDQKAKDVLLKALKIANDNQAYGNMAEIYDLLSNISYKEGSVIEAENMIVDFIEKLHQLGYPENHNNIVRFKLKLARLYQVVGNTDLAELGYRDCIRAQEDKLVKTPNVDNLTNLIYTNSLFWYGKLLADKGEVEKARSQFKKALNRLQYSESISPAQEMVVLYYNAEMATLMKDYDSALLYLYKAIDIGTSAKTYMPIYDLPLYVIKIGFVYLKKGSYENAKFWCYNGSIMAEGNKEAKAEAEHCLNEIERLEIEMKKNENKK